MISLLASIYGAFVLSRRLVSPIQNLVEGTRAVAKGDFDTQLPIPTGDEIGFLVNSFNEMTRGLSLARQQASMSQNLVEAERANLEIILANLSTGVISLESNLKIRTVNKAAGAILNVDFKGRTGDFLSDVSTDNSVLQELYDVVKKQLEKGVTIWQDQIVVHAVKGRRVLTCACTNLSSEAGEEVGFVPARYPGDTSDWSAAQQFARETAWAPLGEDTWAGIGQRLYATSDNDYSALDVRTIAFAADQTSSD